MCRERKRARSYNNATFGLPYSPVEGVFYTLSIETEEIPIIIEILTSQMRLKFVLMNMKLKRVALVAPLLIFAFITWVLFRQRPTTSEEGATLVDRVRSVGLTVGESSFFFDGTPFRILGGSFHYFRTHPDQWSDRLAKMKAAGLNVVTTYVPWNMHETTRGRVEFTGIFDLRSFIELVHKMGFLMIVRPGPYICAEWEFGGLPSWLLHDRNMSVRTSKYQPFLDSVKDYFDRLLPLLARHTYKNGGPIVAFQIENEFGSYGHDNDYMLFLKSLYEKHGLNELYFTSDGEEHLREGSIPGVLQTVNFNKDPLVPMKALKTFQPNKPLMVTEFWPGWFDHWDEDHHRMPVREFVQKVDAILSMNASINFYMFTGGTNFGFWNGANAGGRADLSTITSYDYDALISESGDVHPMKYEALRQLLVKHNLISTPLPLIPQNSPKVALGEVSIKESLQFEDLIKNLPNQPSVLMSPVFMEFLDINEGSGQSFGWILYRSTFKSGKSLRLKGMLQYRGQVFLNGKLLKIIRSNERKILDVSLQLNAPLKEQNVLDILVENMGRVNYKELNGERCGFHGTVELDEKILSPWEHFSLDFSDDFVRKTKKSELWQSFKVEQSPALYRTYVSTNTVEDTFLDMSFWTKGIVLINGFNVGRYWNVGPQQTLYIPKPLLRQGSNEVIVFELEKAAEKVSFISKPILNTRISA